MDGNGTSRRLGVSPFERDMVRDHLERKGLRFLVDQDGDFRVEFGPFRDSAPEMMVWLSAEGPNEDIFVVRMLGNVRVEKLVWDTVIRACNQWNQEKRYPKAFLFLPDDPSALYGQIHLEGQFPMSAGTTQPMVDEYIEVILSTGFSFWDWVIDTGLLGPGQLGGGVEDSPHER